MGYIIGRRAQNANKAGPQGIRPPSPLILVTHRERITSARRRALFARAISFGRMEVAMERRARYGDLIPTRELVMQSARHLRRAGCIHTSAAGSAVPVPASKVELD